jgi:membrane peptidoglycan carboxypeptidase
MMNALTRSLNIPAVRTAERVGRDKIVANMRKMGVKSEIIISRPLPLGAADLTVLEMTQSYTHFAGRNCPSCGAAQKDFSARFCNRCGTALNGS